MVSPSPLCYPHLYSLSVAEDVKSTIHHCEYYVEIIYAEILPILIFSHYADTFSPPYNSLENYLHLAVNYLHLAIDNQDLDINYLDLDIYNVDLAIDYLGWQ